MAFRNPSFGHQGILPAQTMLADRNLAGGESTLMNSAARNLLETKPPAASFLFLAGGGFAANEVPR